MSRRANPDDYIGRVYGYLKVESLELRRLPSGHTMSYAIGHCIHCGAAVSYCVGALSHIADRCPNCWKPHYSAPPPKSEYPAFVVLQRIGEAQGSDTIWECRCKVCGNLCKIPQRNLSKYKSCGCLMEKGRDKGHAVAKQLRRDGTFLPSISPDRALNKNSSTGIKGVNKSKKGKYRAVIVLRGKQIYLGEYYTLEEAAKARRREEEKYFSPEFAEWEANGGDWSQIKGAYQRKTDPRPKSMRNISLVKAKGKYKVTLICRGQHINVGYFATLPEAVAARDKKRAELGLPPIPHE